MTNFRLFVYLPRLQPRSDRGFTMIELLIVITILGALMAAVLFAVSAQRTKAQDSRRKSDLEKLKVAFEDYYNDNACYPASTILDDCNSTDLAPYVATIPCDPSTHEPYVYVPETNACLGYRLYTHLQNVDDPGIVQTGCDQECGCGGPDPTLNYGISSGVVLAQTCPE